MSTARCVASGRDVTPPDLQQPMENGVTFGTANRKSCYI